jgi:hypothetical protein
VPSNLGKIRDMRLSLDEHNIVSNFRVFINGYRVFGSTSNCRLDFQCRPKDDPKNIATFDDIKQELKKYGTIFHLNELYALPYSQTIFPYLVTGTNYVDLHSEASGLGGCGLAVSLKFVFDSGTKERTTIIRPGQGTPAVAQTGAVTVETLYGSGGLRENTIAPYGTHSARGSYRLCERVRLTFDLASSQIDRSDNTWDAQIRQRRNEISCEIPQRRTKACP